MFKSIYFYVHYTESILNFNLAIYAGGRIGFFQRTGQQAKIAVANWLFSCCSQLIVVYS